MRLWGNVMTLYVASIVNGLIFESVLSEARNEPRNSGIYSKRQDERAISSSNAQKLETATHMENPHEHIKQIGADVASMQVRRISQLPETFQRLIQASSQHRSYASEKSRRNLDTRSIDWQFKSSHNNVNPWTGYIQKFAKVVNDVIAKIVPPKSNVPTFSSTQKDLNGPKSRNRIEQGMDLKAQVASTESLSDTTTQGQQVTSDGNELEDLALLLSLQNETYNISSSTEGDSSLESPKEDTNKSKIELDHTEEYKQPQTEKILKRTTTSSTSSTTSQITTHTKEESSETTSVMTTSGGTTTAVPLITTSIISTSTITSTSAISTSITETEEQIASKTTEEMRHGGKWRSKTKHPIFPAERDDKSKLPVKPANKSSLIVVIAVVMMVVFGCLFTALFVLIQVRRNQLKRQLQGANGNPDESGAGVTSPQSSAPNEKASEWAPDKIKASQFTYKGPLQIPFKQQLILKHELENEKPASVHDDQHVQFDDALNEVHEMGSDVEVVIPGEKEKKAIKDVKGAMMQKKDSPLAVLVPKKDNAQVATKD